MVHFLNLDKDSRRILPAKTPVNVSTRVCSRIHLANRSLLYFNVSFVQIFVEKGEHEHE